MEESILTSVRQKLGPSGSYDVFDPQLIDFINAAFSTLHQLGVGTEKPFFITGPDEEWKDFVDAGLLESVRTYVFLRVRLLFDPPANSSVLQAYQKMIEELEWRLNVAGEITSDVSDYAVRKASEAADKAIAAMQEAKAAATAASTSATSSDSSATSAAASAVSAANSAREAKESEQTVTEAVDELFVMDE